MSHKFAVTHKHKLDNPERRKMLPPYETLLKLALRPGDITADVGCGIGYFTLPAAQIVSSEGMVHALDILREMLLAVEQRESESKLTNIKTIKVEENSFPLANSTVTYGFAAFVPHAAQNLVSFLQEFKRILQTNSRAAYIVWEKKEPKMGPPVITV